MDTTIIGHILGYIGGILGLYRDNGKKMDTTGII